MGSTGWGNWKAVVLGPGTILEAAIGGLGVPLLGPAAGRLGLGKCWALKWSPLTRAGPGTSSKALQQAIYYRAGNAKSNSPLLTFVSRPGKTVSLETGPVNLPTCWAQMARVVKGGAEGLVLGVLT